MPSYKPLPCLLLSVFVATSGADAQDAIKIGLAAPISGSFERLGKQMQAGAEVSAKQSGLQFLIEDEACTAEGGRKAAESFVAAGVKIVVGFTCLESLDAALPILRDANIVTISTGVRANALTDNKPKTKHLIYRIAPREDMEVSKLTAQLLARWRSENFAIIDDGTVKARNVAEALRLAATEANLKPVFIDTFRPGLENQAALVRRLQKAGATHVFIGGDIADALIIAKSAKGAFEIALTESDPPEEPADIKDTILSVAIEDYRLLPAAANAVIALQTLGMEPDNYALTTHAAIEIAAQVLSAGKDVTQSLNNINFNTVVGAITFDAKGDLANNPYDLVVLKDGAFKRLGASSQ